MAIKFGPVTQPDAARIVVSVGGMTDRRLQELWDMAIGAARQAESHDERTLAPAALEMHAEICLLRDLVRRLRRDGEGE